MSKIALAGNAGGTGTITLASPNTNTDFTINLPAASGTLVTTGGTVTFGAGTAAAPSITNTNDTNTGIYFPATDTIGFSEGGVESFRLNSSGEGVFAGNVTVAGGVQVGGITTNVYPLVSGTAQSALGTAVEFINIPSWAKRITVTFRAVQTNGAGTARILLQVGSGSYSTSGYTSYVGVFTNTNVTGTASNTTGVLVTTDMGNASLISGHLILTLVENNQWVSSHTLGGTDAASSVVMRSGGGFTPNLSGALDRVRLNTTNETDQFDGGTINIMYE
jgi:hypothetical protein